MPRKTKIPRTQEESSSSKPKKSKSKAKEPRIAVPVSGRKGVTKKIIPSIYLHDSELEGTTLWNRAKLFNWVNFLTFTHDVYPDLVYKFYSLVCVTFPTRDTVRISVEYEGIDYVYTEKDFYDDFGLVNDGHWDYVYGTWPSEGILDYISMARYLNNERQWQNQVDYAPWRSHLNGEDQLIYKCLKQCIVPCTSHETRLTHLNAILLYYIKRSEVVNLPVIIGAHIEDTLRNTASTGLPYGMLISFIMAKWDFMDWGDEDVKLKKGPINRKIIAFQGLRNINSRLYSAWEYDDLHEEVKQAYVASLGRRVPMSTSLRKGHGSIEQQVTELRNDFEAFKLTVDKNLGKLMKGQRLLMEYLKSGGKSEGASASELNVLNYPESEGEDNDVMEALDDVGVGEVSGDVDIGC